MAQSRPDEAEPDAAKKSPTASASSSPPEQTTALTRCERASTVAAGEDVMISAAFEGAAADELTSITLTSSMSNPSSNPASPGPSTLPHECQSKGGEFVPPTRPSSTPFPHPEHRNPVVCCRKPGVEGEEEEAEGQKELQSAEFPESPILPAFLQEQEEEQSDEQIERQSEEQSEEQADEQVEEQVEEQAEGQTEGQSEGQSPAPLFNLNQLPPEIHEAILDHLFGYRVSTSSKSSVGMHSVTRSWGTILRHSRRKELAQLALVSRAWRCLIQQRLYRHIKLKATIDSLDRAMWYFGEHPHLAAYVKHIELWFPVFSQATRLSEVVIPASTYSNPSDKCTLKEAFCFVGHMLPAVRVMTLEGGERKKAPKVQHFSPAEDPDGRYLLPLLSVQTLVTKGQWNLMRDDDDFHTVFSALPNLREWHGSYSKPKSKSYLSMASILPQLPSNLTQLHVCLESDYRREVICPQFFQKVATKLHFCTKLAEAAPALERLSYTGRVCKSFFDILAMNVDPRTTRLKAIDLTVRNCCRQPIQLLNSGCSIQDMSFINAFEQLVLAGIRSLAKLKALEYLRIRYVDLDSLVPPLNPYFLLRDGWCSGVWSDDILTELNSSRPSVQFEDLSESFGDIGYNKDGRMVISPEYPRSRVLSLKLSNYALLTTGAILQQ